MLSVLLVPVLLAAGTGIERKASLSHVWLVQVGDNTRTSQLTRAVQRASSDLRSCTSVAQAAAEYAAGLRKLAVHCAEASTWDHTKHLRSLDTCLSELCLAADARVGSGDDETLAASASQRIVEQRLVSVQEHAQFCEEVAEVAQQLADAQAKLRDTQSEWAAGLKEADEVHSERALAEEAAVKVCLFSQMHSASTSRCQSVIPDTLQPLSLGNITDCALLATDTKNITDCALLATDTNMPTRNS